VTGTFQQKEVREKKYTKSHVVFPYNHVFLRKENIKTTIHFTTKESKDLQIDMTMNAIDTTLTIY
jgi:hypothetical protein